MLGADALHERAKSAVNRGAFVRARSLLDRAETATSDPDLHARIDLTRAYVEAETGEPVAGRERCAGLLDVPGLLDETRGLVWSQLGLLSMRTGDVGRAMDAFARAESLLPTGGEPVGLVLLNRGNVHLQRGDAQAAIADFAAARDHFSRAGGGEVWQAKVEHNLGYARLLNGDIVGALQMIDAAAPVLAAQSAAYRATVEQDRAQIMTAAGRPREAIRALETAAKAYGSRRLRTFQADCELTLAWTLLREDPARARVVARQAARHYRSQQSPVPALRAEAAATVAEISAGGRTPALVRRAEELSQELRRSSHRRDAVLLELQAARVEIDRNQLDDAAARIRRVRVDDRAPVATRLLSREVRAELARARGDRRRAGDHVRAGLADLHEWQSTFGSLDLQSTLVGHGRGLAMQGLRLALDDGRPTLAFEWSERARALVSRVAPVRPPADAQVAGDLAELRLLQSGVGGTATGETQRMAELRARIRQRSWYGEGGGSVGEPAAMEDVQASLATCDAALVAHLVVDDRVSALVVTADDARLVEIGRTTTVRDRLDAIASDLTMAAAHRLGPLAGPIRSSLRARLDAAADELVRPLLPLIGGRRVVLTPSGALAGAPWSLMPGLAGRPVTVPTSATRWIEQRRSPAPPLRSVGLVAGPHLARAEEEVRRAAAEWAVTQVRSGPDATAAEVSALAARVDVLHLAGHGRHQGENPLFAAVELADGPWFGYDIDLLPATPSTVVLSACELGRASVRSGEESVGMTAAWLHAGARTVLSSPVVIADDVACEALAHWHALLARGQSPADALAEVSEAADDVLPLLTFGAGW
ncbi:CHAT domain-containing protein [Nocardioides sp.]|uniref:CHAT domain-containing protein n=1 Tax=Nocardioides sp. TaxID=35761 RepID=UPI002D7FE4CA|nr:CHAT domain-containing protein [Nocardioides sp.]HET8960603.1 CHAT domain-containing protein [Nocardioides sp.]